MPKRLQLKPIRELVAGEEWTALSNHFDLTNRELEVLILTCDDYPLKSMARRLRVRPGTLNQYCERLHRKLGSPRWRRRSRDRISLHPDRSGGGY
jgi:DNA-binding CsgD family transcriptional regulator